MKTILFFHPSSELYGADRILVYIIKQYKSYNKTVLLSTKGPLIELIKKEVPDAKVIVIPELPIMAKKNLKPKGILAFIISLIKFKYYLNKYIIKTPDIIYLNTLAVLPVLLFYSNKRMKKIIHIHEILSNHNIFHKTINKFALRYADLLVCVSKAVYKNMEVINKYSKNKLKLVQNGISFKENDIISSHQLKDGVYKFALIGRIKPSHKGQNLLLEAIHFLDSEILDKCHFYFIGSPVSGQEYMQDEVIHNIKKFGLENKVTLISFVKDIQSIYNQVDVILVPSVFEDPFPTTVLEGMFFSKPVIGTKVGGIPEMIEDTETGFIVNRNDRISLSDKISYFVNNPHKIEEMGKNGKKRFNTYFSEESFIKRYNDFLKENHF